MLRNIITKTILCDSSQTRWWSLTSVAHLHKTVLHDFHVGKEGKMVEFAGYSMPVQYGKVGIATSHKEVRTHCGLFDVSHMLQSKIHGQDRIKFIEKLIVGDIEGLADNTGTLSLFTNPQGGIIDDLICSKTDLGYLYVVSNAGCKEKDLAHLKEHLSSFRAAGGDAQLEVIEDHGLVAVQGPQAAHILQPITEGNLGDLYFMNTREMRVAGIPCRVTRCGYTGEDGVEISVPNNKAVELCETLVGLGVHLAGLGARDSLRLEAGLCLYGNDIDDTTTPIEGGLTWTIGKRRRQTADFLGAEIILRQLKEKPERRRVGLTCSGPPPRSHSPVLDADGNQIGEVTSGCPAPSLGINVAMAYVPAAFAKVGTKLSVQVRKKNIPATVAKMPFVKCNYHNKK
ncbi:aminomethyltransferase, mitochondrial-like [Homarus americanus]|uniref:aminomethyltransferase, mitochondrial-like n=1 Tax=Homarus americanus TaxID=6706 RepID=UPI001C441E39|nr:aminomethyltransferase, mitochondrial-like [Homarus americanus]